MCLTGGLKMTEYIIQPTEYMNQSNFFELLLQWKLSFTSLYTQVIWRAFWRAPEIFPPFKQRSLKFGFLVQHFATFLFDFSVSFSKMKFSPLPDLLNTGFTIIGICLFYIWWLTLGRKKYRDSWLFWQGGDV